MYLCIDGSYCIVSFQLIPHNANATFAKDVNYSQPKYFFQRYEHNTLIRLAN